jgi:hypothetical protein
MSKSISLSSYTIRIKNKKTEKNEKLDKIGLKNEEVDHSEEPYEIDRTRDIADTLNYYFESIDGKFSKDSLLYSNNIKFDKEKRLFRGIIQTGDYGFETDLRNIEDGTVTHRRQKHEAEMLPFYLLISLPKDADEGIVIFQRISNQGIKDSFTRAFRSYFSMHYLDYDLEVNALIPGEIVTQYLNNGSIKKIRLIKYGLHNDITDNYKFQDHVEEKYYYYTEYQLCSFRDKKLPIVDPFVNYVTKKTDLKGLIEVQDFDYDNIKIEVLINKRRRTINLSNLDSIKAYYDITDKVKIGEDGHPQFDSIDAIAYEYLADLTKAMYGEDDAD